MADARLTRLVQQVVIPGLTTAADGGLTRDLDHASGSVDV